MLAQLLNNTERSGLPKFLVAVPNEFTGETLPIGIPGIGAAGEYNPIGAYVQDLVKADVTRAMTPTMFVCELKLTPEEVSQKLSITMCKVITFIGGEIEHYPVFFELSPEAYQGEVPTFMPNRLKEDESIKMWSEYEDGNHPHQEIDGKHYISSNPFGHDLPASIWVQLDGMPGLNIISTSDFLALQ